MTSLVAYGESSGSDSASEDESSGGVVTSDKAQDVRKLLSVLPGRGHIQ